MTNHNDQPPTGKGGPPTLWGMIYKAEEGPPPESGASEEERESRKAIENQARRTANATWFIGLATAVYVVVSSLQLVALRRTLDETRKAAEAATTSSQTAAYAFIFSERPWITAYDGTPIVTDGSLEIDRSGKVTVGITLQIKVSGHSPADYAFTQLKVIANVGRDPKRWVNPVDEQQTWCETIFNDPSYSGGMMFEGTTQQTVWAKMDTRSRRAITKQIAMDGPKEPIRLAVVGCVTYRFAFNAGLGDQAPIIFDLIHHEDEREFLAPGKYSNVALGPPYWGRAPEGLRLKWPNQAKQGNPQLLPPMPQMGSPAP